jgi:hypothetical protein
MVIAEQLEANGDLFSDPWERFRGYGVMALPFASGNILAFRRMTASSVGPSFTSVWHRDPQGFWTMVVDNDPEVSCPRYFGSAMDRVMEEKIELSWDGPRQLSLRVPELRLQWGVKLGSDAITRGLSLAGSVLPGSAWKNRRIRSLVGRVGGRALGVGKFSLSGKTPNGQRFYLVPKVVLRIEATAAVINGGDPGPMGPLENQARLGQGWIPNGGLFAIGEFGYESRKNPKQSTAMRGVS